MKNILLIICLLFPVLTFGQKPVPADPQAESIVLVGGTAHIGNGNVIENSAIGFKNGKIDLVTSSENATDAINKYDKVINISGKQVYPGFIAMNTILGLLEIGAVRATADFAEIGDINPNVRSIIAYNTDSKITPTTRTNGILIAQITPASGLISGSSSVVELDGWNWEDAAFKIDDGIHLNWSRMFTFMNRRSNNPTLKKNEEYNKFINRITKFFEDAKAYSEIKTQSEKNLKFEAVKGLFDGTTSLFIHADLAKEIMEAVDIAKSVGIKKIVLVGGNEAWRITDFLKENNIAVVVRDPHSLPGRREDDVDLPYKLPYLLSKEGITVAIDGSGEPMQLRNIPFYAGTAVAYGMSKEESLKMITSNAAKILGIDDKAGTLEKGKFATLFVSKGDALDMLTNDVEMAFIEGKTVDLRNEQKELYYRYMKKYGLKIK